MFKIIDKIIIKNRIYYIFSLGLLIFFILFLLMSNKEVNYSVLKKPGNYKELYSLIKKLGNDGASYFDKGLNDAVDTEGSSGKKDFSDTNLQVLGVQEADIIKTDGNYIYALSFQKLYIMEANNGDLKLVSSIKHLEEKDNSNSTFTEIYINGDKLIAIKNINTYHGKYNDGVIPEVDSIREFMPLYGNNETGIVIFDIKDKNNPKKINELTQSGSYLSSRMIDNYLYLVTNHNVYDNGYKEIEVNKYIPYTIEVEKEPLEIKDIYIAPNPKYSQYLVVTGVDINNSDSFASKKSVFGSGTMIYSSLNNLYIAGYESIEENGYYKNNTNILKFSLKKGVVELEKTGKVNGTILNQFSMDEYNETFRIVTTSHDYKVYKNDMDTSISNWSEDSKNNLYILDKDLRVIGKIENLAKGEQVYSVRFHQEIVYFVTFRQVDPLFAVDLTNPSKPLIMSELKIPGFSEYLHIYSDKYLFGLGKETDEKGTILGMKISMFDVTNKKDIKEKYKLFLGDEYMWSEASYNHKAILVSPTKNMVAFPTNNSYLVFSFNEEKGFSKIGEINFGNDYWFYNLRGLYIDNFFYIFNSYDLKSYSISNFNNVDSLKLENKDSNKIDVDKEN